MGSKRRKRGEATGCLNVSCFHCNLFAVLVIKKLYYVECSRHVIIITATNANSNWNTTDISYEQAMFVCTFSQLNSFVGIMD